MLMDLFFPVLLHVFLDITGRVLDVTLRLVELAFGFGPLVADSFASSLFDCAFDLVTGSRHRSNSHWFSQDVNRPHRTLLLNPTQGTAD